MHKSITPNLCFLIALWNSPTQGSRCASEANSPTTSSKQFSETHSPTQVQKNAHANLFQQRTSKQSSRPTSTWKSPEPIPTQYRKSKFNDACPETYVQQKCPNRVPRQMSNMATREAFGSQLPIISPKQVFETQLPQQIHIGNAPLNNNLFQQQTSNYLQTDVTTTSS